MTIFAVHNDWRKPRPLTTELIQVVNSWPEYSPNEEREDELQWVLTSNGKFTIRYVWDKLRKRILRVNWY